MRFGATIGFLRKRLGATISTVGHALILGSTLLWFSFSPPPAIPEDAVMVDVVSLNDFSHITAGSRTAPKAETPKPIVDKIGDPQNTKDPAPKVVDKPEIKTDTRATPTPPEPKAKPTEQKSDPIAEALKKEQKKPDPKPKKPQPKLEFSQIENKLALLDKRDPQRQSIAGATLNSTASLGAETGRDSVLDASWKAMLTNRLMDCWGEHLPPGVFNDDTHFASFVVDIHFKRDGSLATDPVVTSVDSGSDPKYRLATEAALRAVRTCAPYAFLPVARYEAWKDAPAGFDTRLIDTSRSTKYAKRRD